MPRERSNTSPAPDHQIGVQPRPHAGRQARILIVEDEAILASALQRVLSADYHVTVAPDAPDALAAIADVQYDLILLDLILQRGTGVEVLGAICRSAAVPPPVLVMSALSGQVDLSQFAPIVTGQMVKPFGLDECRQRVRDALAGRGRPVAVSQALAAVPAPGASVLLVDDDAEFLQGLADVLRRRGYEVQAVATADNALAALARGRYDAVVTDWIMPGATGLQLVQRIKELAPNVPVLLLTGYATTELTRNAISAGAADVLVKPFPPGALPVALEKVLHNQWVGAAPASSPAAKAVGRSKLPGGGVRYSLSDIVGESPVMRRTKETLIRAAALDSVVLIQGETGTGKELFAQALHDLSPRAKGAFVAVNAAAIPENLLESELFGYASGAFTGARKEGHKGRFLQADGGTLFLDEIGDLPLSLQVKLLRVLEEGQVDLIGGGSRQVDVRMVAATHRDLDQMVAEGTFRSDLFYRLNVVTLHLPPLRARTSDIPMIAQRFLSELQGRYGRPGTWISTECFALLQAYDWPGNIRELRNALERAFAMATSDLILPADLPANVLTRPAATLDHRPVSDAPDLASQERGAIIRALEASAGNKVQAAKLLGISRAGLYIKLRIYDIK